MLEVTPQPSSTLSVKPVPQPVLSITPVPQSKLVVGEVCTIGDGELIVLAGVDGPLRTRNGGYLLLDPRYNS